MIRFSTLKSDAVFPTRKHETDAGIDIYPYDPEDRGFIFPGNSVTLVRTGISIEVPENFVGLIWPKSGTDILIGGGVVDAGYQGEIFVKVINPLDRDYVFEGGKAIAQLIIQPVFIDDLVYVSRRVLHSKNTARGFTGGIVTQVAQAELIESPTEF
jgi:dUTP pyrophosphatase